MDRFLAELRDEGITDSRGTFTIDAALARSKMAAFQLPDPASYVLKVVQAAVASGASALEVKSGRDYLSMAFRSADRDLCDTAVVGGAVLRVSSLSRSALRHLAVGLNAGCSVAEELRWETPSGTLLLTTEGLSVEPGGTDLLKLTIRKKRSLLQWFIGSPFFEELRRLSESCLYAPLDLRIDEREIERPRSAHLCGPIPDHLGLFQASPLLEGLRPGRGLRICYGEPGDYEALSPTRWSRRSGRRGPLLLDGWTGAASVEADALLGVAPAMSGLGTWQAVADGVSLQPVIEELDHPAATLIFDAGDLHTDFSEFCLVRDEALTARLAELGASLRALTESVEPPQIEKALRNGGLAEERLPDIVSRLREVLRTHQAQGVQTIEELVFCTFSRGAVSLAPDIPAEKEANALAVHQAHLPSSERVLALYDDTLFGSAKDGFLITERRLCWKKIVMPPNFLLWEELPYLDVQLAGGKITMRGPDDITATNQDVITALFSFLGKVSSVAPPPIPIGDREASVVRLAIETLGKSPNIRCHPHIPQAWLDQVTAVYGALWNSNEAPLVVYDDTLMGKADDGWVATATRLYYKSTFERVRYLQWTEVDARNIGPSSQGLKIGEQVIYAHLQALRPGMVAFAQAMARRDEV